MDEHLLEFATDAQAKVLRTLWREGSQRAAARALECQQSYVSNVVKAVTIKAARAGYAPDHNMTHPAAPGFTVRGTSTLYDEGGNTRLQWVKTSQDREAQEAALRAVADAMAEEIPRAPAEPKPVETRAELCNCYVLTDVHLDMLSWWRETGADWDTEIAEKVVAGCMAQMIESAPRAGKAVIAQLGDFLHSDGFDAVTPTSGNQLDRDTRFEKSVRAAIRTLRLIIRMALARHDEVEVILAEGNHDMASSVWMRSLFEALYEDEPRLRVNTNPLPFYAVQHGNTMLGFHHGHLKKFSGLTGLFAAQFPEVWGATKYRYAHCGHLHHTQSKEDQGMIVTQHQTLAARDAYAARHGYQAERGAQAITYHTDYGEVGTVKVRPEMIQETPS